MLGRQTLELEASDLNGGRVGVAEASVQSTLIAVTTPLLIRWPWLAPDATTPTICTAGTDRNQNRRR